MTTRATQCDANTAASVQEKVEKCFQDIRKSFKTWFDDFMNFSEDESHPVQILQKFSLFVASVDLFSSFPSPTSSASKLVGAAA